VVRTRVAAVARRRLWRLVLTLTGGLTVVGSLPRGGCVVVANHSSHADTAALLAAVPSRHAPRVAAAADYWFAGGWRSPVCRALAAAFPVRRTGGGSADMAGAVALLRAGHVVIVYPEGTRGSGLPARFHSGAFRLAEAAGVPVVPVGIAGTGDLLPKHGRLRRGRVTVRIGAPLPPDPAVARAEVARLADLSRSWSQSGREQSSERQRADHQRGETMAR
jgi:1-acyl-sn-glycerol-3-phosphate acyltransferase